MKYMLPEIFSNKKNVIQKIGKKYFILKYSSLSLF